jgi:hypothetical protein
MFRFTMPTLTKGRASVRSTSSAIIRYTDIVSLTGAQEIAQPVDLALGHVLIVDHSRCRKYLGLLTASLRSTIAAA